MKPRHHPRDERGETLVEVLLAVAIMGIAVVAIMAGLTTSVLMSDIHRKQATAGTAVRDYAEAVQNSVANGNYTPCATAGTPKYVAPDGFTPPSGYSPSIVAGSFRYWNTGTSTWQPSCSSDSGLQRFELQIASADGRATEKVMVVVRKPCRIGDSSCS